MTGRRPKLLDLFCGSMGTSKGYADAGFDVTGVDLVDRPRPDGIRFVQGDAPEYLREHADQYDAIAASPPCHDKTPLSALSGKDGTGWLLTATIALLQRLDKPWIVENVTGARPDMPGALTLCGTEFGLGAVDRDDVYRHLKRHRLFLSNIPLMGAGGCNCRGKLIGGVYGTGGGGHMTRGYKFHLTEARQAMGMPWADRAGVSLAIPPAYTRFLGEQILAHLTAEVAA